MTVVLGAPAAALGFVEGLSDAISGFAKLAGGALADDPQRRRRVALGGYVATAILSASVGLATTAWQVAVLRSSAWAARGIRGPARNALLADAVEPRFFGRAYGFERALDNAGAIIGPLLAIALVAAVGIRGAILLSVIPGLFAAGAIAYAINNLRTETPREHRPIRLVIRPLLHGRLGRLLGRHHGVRAGERGHEPAHPPRHGAVHPLDGRRPGRDHRHRPVCRLQRGGDRRLVPGGTRRGRRRWGRGCSGSGSRCSPCPMRSWR